MQKDTKWCVAIWQQWSQQRDTSSTDTISDITANPVDIDYLPQWLCLFILETKKQKGQSYPPETLYHIFCGIMRQVSLTRPGIDFFHYKAFAECRTVLDSEMKRLKRGVVVKVRKAEPLTEEEQILWDKGILEDHSPHALLNTVFFQNGINFALRSGGEHHSLRNTSNGCQIRAF